MVKIKGGCIRTTKRGSKVQRCIFEIKTLGKSRGLVIDLVDEKIEIDLDKILNAIKRVN